MIHAAVFFAGLALGITATYLVELWIVTGRRVWFRAGIEEPGGGFGTVTPRDPDGPRVCMCRLDSDCPEHGLRPADPVPLDVERLARALHRASTEAHLRHKCHDRHDIRAALIAAEYARLTDSPEPR